MRLAIIILNYRTPGLVIDCLASLEAQVTSLDGVQVGVIDNASGDGSPEMIQEAIEKRGWSSWCELHRSSENRGFSAGNNSGMRLYGAPLYFLLNSDTIVHEGAIASLLEAAEAHPRAGLIGPACLRPDGSVDSSHFQIPGVLSELVRGAQLSVISRIFKKHVVAPPPSSEVAQVPWLSFAAVVVRGEALRDVGPMDEGYFMYFEDVDYGRRVAQAGWEIIYWPKARITHIGSGSSEGSDTLPRHRVRPPRFFYESRSRYFGKFSGLAGLWLANLLWTLGRFLSFLCEVITRRPPHCRDGELRDIWIRCRKPLHPPSPLTEQRAQ